MTISQQYTRVAAEVAQACRDCGRDPSQVTLLAVSKTVQAPRVQEAIDAGACAFGENRPEQLMEKHAAYPSQQWHFIGNLQSRRIHDIVPCATLMHSVYKASHLPKIDAAAQQVGKVQDILLEVNVSGEESKGGIAPAQINDLLSAAEGLAHVRVRGLMTMAPRGDMEIARETFAHLRELEQRINREWRGAQGSPLSELSMGMSEDWRCAISEGSTIVRIGRAIFSEDFA